MLRSSSPSKSGVPDFGMSFETKSATADFATNSPNTSKPVFDAGDERKSMGMRLSDLITP